MPEVSNLRKLYAIKEGTGRIKVLVLNESSTPMELSGKKINTPRRSLFLNKRSMILLISKEHKLKMIFHHKTTSKKARTSFKRRLMHLKKLPSLGQVGSQDYIKFYFIKHNYDSKDSHQDDVDPEEEELESS